MHFHDEIFNVFYLRAKLLLALILSHTFINTVHEHTYIFWIIFQLVKCRFY